jgi:hypothetical protein
MPVHRKAGHQHLELRSIEHERTLRAGAAGNDGARGWPAGRVTQLGHAVDRDDAAGPDAIDRGRLLVPAGDARLVFAELRERNLKVRRG